MCTDEATLPDDRAVENDRTHADQGFVADRAGMDNGTVSYGDTFPDGRPLACRDMNHCIVLNIALIPDHDGGDVTSQRGSWPDACTCPDTHVSRKECTGRDVGSLSEAGSSIKMLAYNFCKVVKMIRMTNVTSWVDCGVSIHAVFLVFCRMSVDSKRWFFLDHSCHTTQTNPTQQNNP